ncbi:MAG: hypothetical protein U0326_09095 [Polyangiales bacterium]
MLKRTTSLALLSLTLNACDDTASAPADAATDARDASADVSPDGGAPSALVFDLDADLTVSEHFYDLPYPSDLRLASNGAPDLRGFPYPPNVRGLITGLLEIAQDRRGFPVLPVAYFRFSNALAAQDGAAVIPATGSAAVMLLDIDPASPERGRRFPVVAATPPEDAYTPANMLAVAARPGFVLHGARKYAFVVMRALRDARGQPLAQNPTLAQLSQNMGPATPRAMAARTLYAPLWETLSMASIDRAEVAAATVFTTGDVVADTAALGDRVVERHDVTIDNLRVAMGDSPTTHPRYCQLTGTVTMPQFQRGAPPFDTDGLFDLDTQGYPRPQTYASLPNYARVPVTLTLPRRAMPAAGYPLAVYFHGSGGVSTAVVDRGTWAPRSATHPCADGHLDTWMGVMGCNTLGEGPAHVMGARGIAMAGAAMPVNPERLPGAGETAYLNLTNLKAFRDTFRQGVMEQRLFIEALERLRIPASVVAACTGATLPTGVTEARYDTSRLIAQGQSMGGMYTNLISATEPHIRASIPTGAGGYWGYFILQTGLVPGAAILLRTVLGTQVALSFMHPGLALLETAWEPAEPMAYMPRIARDPLPTHPVRPIYEPVGQGDSYFPTVVYDAVALAYGHQQAGAEVWPTMQPALTLGGLGGTIRYPVRNNRMSASMATPYTGVVVQYTGDGVYDPHALYTQLDAVKFQYSCFADTFVRTGMATVFDPAGRAPDAPCE